MYRCRNFGQDAEIPGQIRQKAALLCPVRQEKKGIYRRRKCNGINLLVLLDIQKSGNNLEMTELFNETVGKGKGAFML